MGKQNKVAFSKLFHLISIFFYHDQINFHKYFLIIHVDESFYERLNPLLFQIKP